MGAMFRTQGSWLVLVDGFGPRSAADFPLGFTLVGSHSETRDGLEMDVFPLLLIEETCPVCC